MTSTKPRCSTSCGGGLQMQVKNIETAPAYGVPDKDLDDPAFEPTEFDRPAEADADVADGCPPRADQPDRTVWCPFEKGNHRFATVVIVARYACFLVEGGDHGEQFFDIVGTGEVERFHRRASRSVSSEKKASASRSPMKVALAGRSETRHQSATVMPMVSSDVVSISTLMWRPLKISGRIR